MLVTKDLDKKVFDYIYPWGKKLASIAWAIRAPYNHTIMATPCQSVFGRDMLFELTLVVDWRVATSAKQRQVDIDNFREDARQVMHNYAIGNRVYVEITGIYRKIYYKKQGTYRITEVFTNSTVRFQLGQVNELVSIRRLNNHFHE